MARGPRQLEKLRTELIGLRIGCQLHEQMPPANRLRAEAASSQDIAEAVDATVRAGHGEAARAMLAQARSDVPATGRDLWELAAGESRLPVLGDFRTGASSSGDPNARAPSPLDQPSGYYSPNGSSPSASSAAASASPVVPTNPTRFRLNRSLQSHAPGRAGR